MTCIENRYITSPNAHGDGLTLCDGRHHVIRNCIVDFSGNDLQSIDEALGITWGASAEVHNCVFRGAGKLVLCGSGDTDKINVEMGKHVLFRECLFENFSRRGPEAQDGMVVELNNCVIRHWGDRERFSVRSFGAWAHGKGSAIYTHNCVFWQDMLFTRHALRDMIAHIGQAYNDSGLKGLFSRDAWLPGQWRGLTASQGASARAWRCYRNHRWIALDNFTDGMDKDRALGLVAKLDAMKNNLLAVLGGAKK